MNDQLFAEIQDDMWHILLHVHVLQERSTQIAAGSPTRHQLLGDWIALNSISENIVIRLARIADKNKNVRSLKNLLKNVTVSKEVLKRQEQFVDQVKAVTDLRHTRIAHMKAGDLSKYPIELLTKPVIDSLATLIHLLDELAGKRINYYLALGRTERRIDLRKSVSQEPAVECGAVSGEHAADS